MTDTPQDQPLWRVMFRAYEDAPGFGDEAGYAAEIRAVADEIEAQCGDFAQTSTDPVGEVVSWLRAEADRAERGES